MFFFIFIKNNKKSLHSFSLDQCIEMACELCKNINIGWNYYLAKFINTYYYLNDIEFFVWILPAQGIIDI